MVEESFSQNVKKAVDKSIEGQDPSWKNLLSRKTSEYLSGGEGLSFRKDLSMAIDKSIQDQPNAWYNWLSRKTSEYLFGDEFPYVPTEIKDSVGVLNLPDEQRRYLEAYHTLSVVNSDTKKNLFPAFVRSAKKMRDRLSSENKDLSFEDIGNKMDGLILASKRTLMLTSSVALRDKANFGLELKKVSEGMVEGDTKFFEDVREFAEKTESEDDEKKRPSVSSLLNLSDEEDRYIQAIARTKEGFVGTNKEEALVELAHAARDLRNYIDKDNPSSPEAGDRMRGLSLACERMRLIIGDQHLMRLSGYLPALRKASEGLVDRETKFFKDFRESLKDE